jgi:hypothetical protein
MDKAVEGLVARQVRRLKATPSPKRRRENPGSCDAISRLALLTPDVLKSVNVIIIKMWTYGVITYLRRALKAGILKTDLNNWELKKLFTTQYERGWHIDISRKISKAHFLGYAARYIRRPPIAQHRFQEIDGPTVKFWTKDTKTTETVLDELPKKDFIEMLAEHVADRYQHAIRYYGLLSPRSRGREFATLFAFLGKARRPRVPRLSWADSIKRCFGRNPLIDSRGRPMQSAGTAQPRLNSLLAIHPVQQAGQFVSSCALRNLKSAICILGVWSLLSFFSIRAMNVSFLAKPASCNEFLFFL